MNQTLSYWATDEDEHFEAGHYVEAWELNRVSLLSPGAIELLHQERTVGNKIRSIQKGLIELAQPLDQRVWCLPDGLVFWCPLQEQHIGHYDGDECGAVVCLATGTRISPTGHEAALQPEHQPTERSAA